MFLKLEKIIKFCVFVAVMILNVYATTNYLKSDLEISSSSRKFSVQFYNNASLTIHCNPDGSETIRGCYASAIIYAKEKIEDLPLKFNGSVYYFCLDEESEYHGHAEALEEFSQSTFLQPSASALSHSIEHNGHMESSLDALCQHILSSDSICVTFGAGISGGYVPTLVEFFNALELEKSDAIDAATDASFMAFISRLVTSKNEILNIIQTEWGKVWNCQICSTPAHDALKQLIELLRNKGINTFIYTDNIDRIHHKIGLQLSEETISDGTRIIYPPLDSIRDKKVTVLVCGQSFDFHAILSTIHARATSAREIDFFHLNLTPDRIEIFKGLDVGFLLESSPEIDISKFQRETLGMQFIPGNLHELFPALYEKLKEKLG